MRETLIGVAAMLMLAAGAARAGQAPEAAPASSAKPLLGETEPMAVRTAGELVDMEVVGASGETLGVVHDVAVAPDGTARELVVATGDGSPGAKRIVVDAARAERISDDVIAVAELDREEIDAAPSVPDDATVSPSGQIRWRQGGTPDRSRGPPR